MKSITIKIGDGLYNELEKSMNPCYTTKTEFIREAIRDKIKEKEELIKKLYDLKGSLKGKAKMTEKEAGEIAIKDIARRLNISLD